MTVPTNKKSPLGWLLSIGALLVLAAAGAYVYFFVLVPSPRAHLHVPEGTQIAARVDAIELATFKPVRQHLWPLVLEEGQADPEKSKRLDRIAEATGVRIPTDFREAVLASPDGVAWVAVVAGTFDRGRFVAGMERVLAEERITGWKRDGELLIHTLGFAMGQAEDGTLVFGTGRDIAQAALPERQEAADLPLPKEEALGFYLSSKAYRGGVSGLPLSIPGLDALDEIDHVTGTFRLSNEPLLSMVAEPKDGVDAGKLAAKLSDVLSKAKLMTLFIKDDPYGARKALTNASVRQDGGKVRLEAPWPYDALEAGVKHLAELSR